MMNIGMNRLCGGGMMRHMEGGAMRTADNCLCPTEEVRRECFVKETRTTTNFHRVPECKLGECDPQ